MKNKRSIHEPTMCSHCGQTTDYALPLDRGTALIVLAVYNAVQRLDRNRVHLINDMLCMPEEYADYRAMVHTGHMTARMIGNSSRARYHGLIAFADESGEYLITPKGRDFLLGSKVPRIAIIDKKTHTKKIYLDPENDRTGFLELMGSVGTPFWDIDRDVAYRHLGAAVTGTQSLGI